MLCTDHITENLEVRLAEGENSRLCPDDGQTGHNAINSFDSRAAASKDATSVREHHLGFQACVAVVLSIQIAKNLKSQITGAVSRSHSPHAEIIFHQVGNVRDVGGV